MSLQTKEVCVCDCPNCDVERDKDTNHWWIISRGKDNFLVTAWNYSDASVEGVRHYCGMTCAMKAISELMLGMVKA